MTKGHMAGGRGPDSQFGALVRAYRLEAGLTQQDLAARAGLSVAALRDFEQSRRQHPRPSSLAALIDALDLDIDQATGLRRAAELSRHAGDAAAYTRRQAGVAGRPDGLIRPDQGLWLSVLGPLEAWRDGTPISLGPPARRAVLGLLSMNPGVLMRRDMIVDVLWGEEPPRTAVGLVQAHVSRLRKVLNPRKHREGGDGVINSVGGAYTLRLSAGELDVSVFDDLAVRAAAARADGDDLAACELYERAVRLWRGDPLVDVDLLDGYSGITLLRHRLVDVLLRYADAACALGQYHRVLPRLRVLAAAEPLNEPAHARLMITLAGVGEQAAAIRLYEDLRLRLDRELGLYPGEELAEAHVRVVRQDIRGIDSGRAYPRRATPPAVSMVPRQLPAAVRFFTGRRDELGWLSGLVKRHSAEASGVVIAALTGMAGIGKTTLAVHWAHQVAAQFPDGQLFVDLRGFGPCDIPVTPTEAMCGFLTALGIPPERVPVDAAGQTALFRSLLVGRSMLIVLDNARNAEQIRPLLPGSPGCMVLVTSRNRLTGLAAAEGAHLFTLGVLTEGESRDLLAKNLGAERASAEPAAVAELIERCARLPLALCDVAARAVARPRLPLSALATEMRDEQGRLDALETRESATSVRIAFFWSKARLSESAARMFRLIGLHPGPDITAPAAASLAAVPRSEAYLALAELCDEHLLSEQVPGRYACHDLLRAYAAEQARTRHCEAERRAAVHRVLDHYLHTADAAAVSLCPSRLRLTGNPLRSGALPEEIDDRELAVKWSQNERHVLLAAMRHAAEEGYAPHAWLLPWSAGPLFRGETHWRKLKAAQELALAVAARLDDPAGLALARYHLGLLSLWLGDHADACHHLDEAVELARTLGDCRLHALAGLSRARVPESHCNPITSNCLCPAVEHIPLPHI